VIFGSGCLCEPIQIIKISQSWPVLIPTRARPYPHAGAAHPYPLSLSLHLSRSLSISLTGPHGCGSQRLARSTRSVWPSTVSRRGGSQSMGARWCSCATYSGTSMVATPSLSTAAPPSLGWTTVNSARCQARWWLPSPLVVPFLGDLPHHPRAR
jgi:hypothetical protein